METIAERILTAIKHEPLDDDVLAKRLGVSPRHTINTVARGLEAQGRLRRYRGPEGKIVNELVGDRSDPSIPPPTQKARVDQGVGVGRITEDEVKEAVRANLALGGFDVQVAWGRTRGIDIDARHSDGRRYIIEAKAEVGKNGPQQVNYFIGMLGELIQRKDDPSARYGIALPRNKQYQGLVGRLPGAARERLNLAVFWVAAMATPSGWTSIRPGSPIDTRKENALARLRASSARVSAASAVTAASRLRVCGQGAKQQLQSSTGPDSWQIRLGQVGGPIREHPPLSPPGPRQHAWRPFN